MRKIKNCPDCNSIKHSVYTGPFTGDRYVKCDDCGFRGQYRVTTDEAIQAWNETIVGRKKRGA